MANYQTLKTAIQQVVKTNGNNEITGALLQQSLLTMINTLGVGYQFAGIATPTTNPGTPDANVFYVAQSSGTYLKFDGITVFPGEFAVLKYNGSWEKSASLSSFVRLKKIGSAGTPTDLSIGDLYTPSIDYLSVLRVTGISDGVVSSYDEYPKEKNTLYGVNNDLYSYNGTTMVKLDLGTPIITELIECFGNPIVKLTIQNQDYYIKDLYFDESYGLKQGYQLSGGWENDASRVSTKMINALNDNINVKSTGDIIIAGVVRRNATLGYVDYISLNAAESTLQPGYYYMVVFRHINYEDITPNDVAPHVTIGNKSTIANNTALISKIEELISPIIDMDLDITETGKWYSGTQIGQSLSVIDYPNTKTIKVLVNSGEIYQYSGTGGSGGRAWYLLDSSNKILDLAVDGFSGTQEIAIPTGVASILAQSTGTLSLIKKGEISAMSNIIEKVANQIELIENKTIFNSFKAKTPFVWNKLNRLKQLGTGFANIGFIGDSWTQGTENVIGGVNQGDFQGYVRPLTKMLQDEYGFGGLGWLDFSRDGGTGKMFGCAEMYEHWTYSFSGNVTGVDGSESGQSVNCLGICCAHTIFGNGANLTLGFNAGYLDKFKIRYYKNAHFTVSINGGSAVEITANANDGWQETTFGTTGTDITTVVITSLADNTIIFGMDCFYGTKGVRCHKIGNRSISASQYLAMNATQWEDGIRLLELDWCSVMLAINDLGGSTDPSRMDAIVTNISNLIDRAKIARTVNDLVVCDFNVLGIENIESATWTGLAMLAEKERQMAINNNYGWANSALPIGTKKAEFVYTGTFSDTIHLNAIGAFAYAKHIYNSLFKL